MVSSGGNRWNTKIYFRSMTYKRRFFIFQIIFLIVIIIVIIAERIKIYNRNHYFDYAYGEVTETGHTARVNNYVAYKFQVGGVTYYGSDDIRYCKKCQFECCKPGTKVKIKYYIKKPLNNELVEE